MMRLRDVGMPRRQTKLIYRNHQLPPRLTEDTAHDRSDRLLDGAFGNTYIRYPIRLSAHQT